MNNLSATLTISMLCFSLLLNGGCFYLVEDGKGGVAERFPIDVERQPSGPVYSARLQKSKERLQQHHRSGNSHRFPVRYDDIDRLLIRSQRLYVAGFHQQADHPLQQAEAMLRQLSTAGTGNKHLTMTLKPENPTARSDQEEPGT